MSDFLDLSGNRKGKTNLGFDSAMPESPESNVPSYGTLKTQLDEANLLVDDIVLKNYLTKLIDLEIVPLDDSLKQIGDIRLFKITEMVYQNDECSTYKFASVFNAVQNLNCGVFVMLNSDGQKTDFYMGVRALDDIRTTKSLKDTLKNALCGQFPGVKTVDLLDPEAKELLSNVASNNIAAVSCVAKNKDEEFTDNKRFIQGFEKLAIAMQGQRYTAIVLAKSTPAEQLADTRQAYETIYTHLSPFANMQMSYGTNTALSVTDAFSKGTSRGTAHTTNTSTQRGTSYSKSTTVNDSTTKQDVFGSVAKGVSQTLIGAASIVAAPFTGGASLVAGGAAMAVVSSIPVASKTKGSSFSKNYTENSSKSYGESDSFNESVTESVSNTKGLTSGKTDNMQLTMQNKTLLNTLERIDSQLKRIDECESLGMWECAAYFLSGNQETAEMAAGTYKALMKGEKSGVETSAVNLWGRTKNKQTSLLCEYITNFIHPIFEYRSSSSVIPVTASSLISGNELAIQMGLPRKSVCGFPVIEHADFGKEVVKHNQRSVERNFALGKVFCMGSETKAEARLDRDSLTMHTFITGSTGSGKSNTVYEILNQLRNVYNIPFLVVEPTKGEYKNVFGHFPDVATYGTNPKKTKLLRINPFRFSDDIHVLEHLDRLTELFNVCWPMYAAMPAILKDAMERAYVAVGWNIEESVNPRCEFPNFLEVLAQIKTVINESDYSKDSKNDYSGALITRIRSLTTGLNRLIFCNDDLADVDLFDKNVIVDLSRVGSTETKSLIMGLLVLKLNEYRMTSGKINSPLSHVTVLEEAHNLLKRTSTEQSAEGSNILGKSVEMLANSIAEMRTYGEGFIVADQSPGMLDMSVIRNTNTKIILRLPEQSDRELVGFAASLNQEQIEELSKLEKGVAAVYQNDWVEPVLVKINKCEIIEKPFEYNGEICGFNEVDIERQIIHMLIQGRVSERLDFDTTEIQNSLTSLPLTLKQRDFIERYIDEYETHGDISIWRNEKFELLSKYIGKLSGLESKVDDIVTEARSNSELTEEISYAVKQRIPNLSDEVAFALAHCLMKNFSVQQEETAVRERTYKQWVDSERERGIR